MKVDGELRGGGQGEGGNGKKESGSRPELGSPSSPGQRLRMTSALDQDMNME